MQNTTLRDLYDALEDDNHANLCAMLLAVVNRDRQAVIRLGEIVKIHAEQGSMPYELVQERYEIQKPLWARFTGREG